MYATWLFASGIGPNLEDRSGLDEGDEEVLVYKGRNGEAESRIVTWYDENGEKHSGVRRICYSKDDDWDIPSKYRFYQSYRLKDSYILPSPAQNKNEQEASYTYNPRGTEAIKQQLLANRGVSICINAETTRRRSGNISARTGRSTPTKVYSTIRTPSALWDGTTIMPKRTLSRVISRRKTAPGCAGTAGAPITMIFP